jgi:hypothetical protein
MLAPLSSAAISTPAVLVTSVGMGRIRLPRESALLLGAGRSAGDALRSLRVCGGGGWWTRRRLVSALDHAFLHMVLVGFLNPLGCVAAIAAANVATVAVVSVSAVAGFAARPCDRRGIDVDAGRYIWLVEIWIGFIGRIGVLAIEGARPAAATVRASAFVHLH